MKTILHIDINSFYASCEMAVDETLKGKPVVVVSSLTGRNCILLAVSYEARKYGIVRTMSFKQAQSLCKDLVVRVANHHMYQEFSDQFVSILCEYAPIVEALSIDEAYLDMTGTERLYGDIKEFAKKLQDRILKDLLLPTSIGIADNKMLAKMGSDYKKPMGISELYSKNVEKLIWPLSVDKLWGVGGKTADLLQKMGVYTIGDLAKFDKTQLRIHLGEKMSEMLHEYANGIDDSPVVPYDRDSVKSTGKEITFEEDIIKEEDVKKNFLIMAEKLASRLREMSKRARTVTIKIKYNNFTITNRSHTLDINFNTTGVIYKTACELYRKHCVKTIPIRLLGIQVSGFEENCSNQMCLFVSENEDKNERFEKSVDEIRRKFGYNIIGRAKTK